MWPGLRCGSPQALPFNFRREYYSDQTLLVQPIIRYVPRVLNRPHRVVSLLTGNELELFLLPEKIAEYSFLCHGCHELNDIFLKD